MAAKRTRPPLRLLFDEVLPYRVARALHELGFRTSHVGHEGHGQPARGSTDAMVLRHAVASNQIIATSNHDMIILCAEQRQPVVWIDPRGRQFTHDELAFVAFRGIATWHRLLQEAEARSLRVHVLRTKVEVLDLDRVTAVAERRMRALKGRKRTRRRRRAELTGQMEVAGDSAP